MEKPQFFFMFSQGSYSDYSVGGLCVCDHAVTEAEWDAHYKAYQEEHARRYAPIRAIPWEERTGRPELEEFWQWERENQPEASFQKLHNMQEVGVTELWRDG